MVEPPLRDFLDPRGYCIVLYDTFAFTLGLLLDDRKTWLWVMACFHSIPSFLLGHSAVNRRAGAASAWPRTPLQPIQRYLLLLLIHLIHLGGKTVGNLTNIYYIYITCNTSRAGSLIWHFGANWDFFTIDD